MIDRSRFLERLQNVRRVHDQQYQASCPAHRDSEPSLSVTFTAERILLHCFAGCSTDAIVAALGLEWRDLFAAPMDTPSGGGEAAKRRSGEPARGMTAWADSPTPKRSVSTPPPPGKPIAGGRLTVARLAEAKGIPEEFLREWGLFERGGAVVIPYKDASGETRAERIRTHVTAAEGSRWVKGHVPILYGLHRLDGDDTLFLVEGESDTWTLALHRLPVLGVPGATLTEKITPEVLGPVRTLYVVQEPDQGGWAFVNGISRRLRETSWRGRAFVIRMERLGVKDPNALHLQDPGRFRAVFRKAMDDAEQLVWRDDEDDEAEPSTVGDYQEARDGLCLIKSVRDSLEKVKLANFTARIVADLHHDDGVESARFFQIQSQLKGRTASFILPARQFDSLGWIHDKIGAEAVVFPGRSLRDHVRVAIQLLSRSIRHRTVFTHTGWREMDGQWTYLHGTGAIGADGDLSGVEVELPKGLGGFALPAVPHRLDLTDAVADSLKMIEVAPDAVTLPVFAAVWRAVLGSADFGLHLTGPSGSGKSELAALAQQHFGAGLNARHLPGGWSSTGNALEVLAFSLKDTLCVVDDFAPHGGATDVWRYHREAERLFRAQGNLAGRMRLSRDGQLLAERPPRGLVLSTGEDVPHGHSIRARLLVLELEPGAMRWESLTECQRLAAEGRFAAAAAGFVQWLARRYPEARTALREDIQRYRNALTLMGGHKRTPANLAELAAGLRIFLLFAVEIHAIAEPLAESVWSRAWACFGEVARTQAQQQEAADPVQRFFELLHAALASGTAHLAGRDGGCPASPGAWGWRENPSSQGPLRSSVWEPHGQRVGWVDGEDVYLMPDAAYRAVQAMSTGGGEGIHLSPTTLWRRLRERGALAACEANKRTLTVRRTLEGRNRPVLFLRPGLLNIPADKADKEGTYPNGINELSLSAWQNEADNVLPKPPLMLTKSILPSTERVDSASLWEHDCQPIVSLKRPC